MFAKLFLLASVAAVCSAASAGSRSLPDPSTAQCDAQGLVFLLLPHHTECDKYYMCAHGQEVEFTCPGGLIFDYQLQTCNWPWATQCWLRQAEVEESNESEELIDGEGSGEGSGFGDWEADSASTASAALHSGVHVDSDHGVTELNCAAPQMSTKMAAYRGDCQRFWRCNNGAAEAAFCSDGLYFNSRTLQCDFEANVPCARDAQVVDEIGVEFLPY